MHGFRLLDARRYEAGCFAIRGTQRYLGPQRTGLRIGEPRRLNCLAIRIVRAGGGEPDGFARLLAQ